MLQFRAVEGLQKRIRQKGLTSERKAHTSRAGGGEFAPDPFPLSSDKIFGVQIAPTHSEFSYDVSRASACDADWSTTGGRSYRNLAWVNFELVNVSDQFAKTGPQEPPLNDSSRGHSGPIANIASRFCTTKMRIPEKATTLSGAWRPRDPVDDDQGGARA